MARYKAKALLTVLIACALALSNTNTLAQSFPSKPITLVVGFTAGGIADTSARMVAKALGDKLGQPVLVENKAGAGGIVAAEIVANAKPDGYTLFYGSNGPLGTYKSLYKKLSYDPLTSFTPIHGLSLTPQLVVVANESRFKTIQELIAFAKNNPNKLTYGTSGSGSAQHMSAELMSKSTGIKMTHIPYKGSAPTMVDILGGRIDLTFDYSGIVKPLLDAGKIRALASTGAQRIKLLPEIPTLVELGYPDMVFSAWSTVVGPAGMPDDVVTRLSGAIGEVLNEPSVVTYFNSNGAALMTETDHTKLTNFLVAEQARFKELIELTGATAE